MKEIGWKPPWRNLLLASLVVVASVYVAIVLEGGLAGEGAARQCLSCVDHSQG